MKFGKKILSIAEADTTLLNPSDWIDYKRLKKLIKACAPSTENATETRNNGLTAANENKNEILKSSKAEKTFFIKLLLELKKVSAVYTKLETSILQDFLLFIPVLEQVKYNSHNMNINGNNSPAGLGSGLGQEEAMKECADHHYKFILLENYAVLNYCGFTKILKKHDKCTGFLTREKYMKKIVQEAPFSKHEKINIATKLVLNEFFLLSQLKMNAQHFSNPMQVGPAIQSMQQMPINSTGLALMASPASLADPFSARNHNQVNNPFGLQFPPGGMAFDLNTLLSLRNQNQPLTLGFHVDHQQQMDNNRYAQHALIQAKLDARLHNDSDSDVKEEDVEVSKTEKQLAQQQEDAARANRLDDLVSLLEKHQEDYKRAGATSTSTLHRKHPLSISVDADNQNKKAKMAEKQTK